MKASNIDIEKLKRNKYSTPESKFEWLASALMFVNEVKKNASRKKL